MAPAAPVTSASLAVTGFWPPLLTGAPLPSGVASVADRLAEITLERLGVPFAWLASVDLAAGSVHTIGLRTNGPDADRYMDRILSLVRHAGDRADPLVVEVGAGGGAPGALPGGEIAFLGVPFRPPGSDVPVGVLAVADAADRRWTRQEIVLAEVLARLAASELERAGEREGRRHAQALVEAQNQVLRSIGSGASLAETLDVLCRRLEALLGDARCAVFETDADHGPLVPRATGSLPEAFRERFAAVDVDGPEPYALAAREARVVVVHDVSADGSWPGFGAAAAELGIRACWAAPVQGESGGLLGVFTCHYPAVRTPAAWEIDLVEALGRTTGVAIEHARAARALRDSEARFRDLVETSSDYIWEMDEHGVNVYSSPQVRQIMGYDPEEVVGMTPTDPMSSDERDRLSSVYDAIIASRQPFHCLENVNITKDGQTVVLETSGVPIYDEQGRFRGYRGIDRDITKRKRLEEQLRISQKLEAVGRLAGGVAHDFNNLLTAIMGHVELMAMDLPQDDPLRESLEEIRHASERASSLTSQLLAFSRQQVLQPEVLDLNGVVTSMRRMLARLLPAHVELRLELTDPLGPVRVDPGQMEQVIVNLAVNASDAMPEGGVLTVRTFETAAEAADVPGDETEPETCVVLEVEDDGVGMSAEVRSQIFEPFFTTKPRGKGTGLGLSTVYGIVQQSGGSVRVESRVDRGSRFRIYLPRLEGAASSASPGDAGEALEGSETVLLVEDEEAVRTLVRKALERHGYQVIEAENGVAGLKAANRHEGGFDLLLTDVVMPEMGGPDLAAELRARRPDLPVLFMSGYAGEGIVRGNVLDPAVDLLQKPFSQKELLGRIRTALRRRPGR